MCTRKTGDIAICLLSDHMYELDPCSFLEEVTYFHDTQLLMLLAQLVLFGFHFP